MSNEARKTRVEGRTPKLVRLRALRRDGSGNWVKTNGTYVVDSKGHVELRPVQPGADR